MLYPIVGGAVLVWPGPGLLTSLPEQGSYGSLQFALTWPCLPLVLPQEDASAYFLRRFTQTLSQALPDTSVLRTRSFPVAASLV